MADQIDEPFARQFLQHLYAAVNPHDACLKPEQLVSDTLALTGYLRARFVSLKEGDETSAAASATRQCEALTLAKSMGKEFPR